MEQQGRTANVLQAAEHVVKGCISSWACYSHVTLDGAIKGHRQHLQNRHTCHGVVPIDADRDEHEHTEIEDQEVLQLVPLFL